MQRASSINIVKMHRSVRGTGGERHDECHDRYQSLVWPFLAGNRLHPGHDGRSWRQPLPLRKEQEDDREDMRAATHLTRVGV